MKRYFFKRTISGVFNFCFIIMINFLLMASIKGDVASKIIPLEVKKSLREGYGLNKSAFEQFIIWLKKLLKGDMGKSYMGQWTGKWGVKVQVHEMFIKTVQIMIPAIIAATIITIVVSTILHMKKRSSFTQLVVKLICYSGISLPSFIVAKLAIKLFTGYEDVQDYIGRSTYNVILTGREFPFYKFTLWVIPFAAVTFVATACLFKYLDSLLAEVMNSEFVQMARAKGLKDKTVMYRHAIRYSACPFITAISLTLIGLMGSQFLIEIITKWNGLGSGLCSSIFYRDYPITMGILLYMTMITLVINMVVDFIYTLLDPRIKLNG